MTASFSRYWIQERDAKRQELADDYQRFLASGRKPVVLAPQKSAHDYAKKRSRQDEAKERKEKLGIGSVPQGVQINTMADVLKRQRERAGGVNAGA